MSGCAIGLTARFDITKNKYSVFLTLSQVQTVLFSILFWRLAFRDEEEWMVKRKERQTRLTPTRGYATWIA